MSLAIFIAAGCLTSAAVASAVTYYAVNWSRDRQAENDNARRELAIEHGLRLALENQQLEQRVSGEQPAVEPIEVEPFMADSGYRPPRRFDDAELLGPDQLAEMRTYSLDEVIDELGITQDEIDAADDEPDYAGWAQGLSLDPTVEHLGQACGWSEDGQTDCGDPAEGWTRWPDGTVVWLCAGHFQWVRQDAEDDGPETLPRVLPEGRVSD